MEVRGTMTDKIIITAAVNGSRPTKEMHDAVPYSPDEIAQAAISCYEAGAAIVHVHVRDPVSGAPSSDFELFKATVDRIRAACGVLINLTTSGFHLAGADVTERRLEPLRLRPDLCSFDIGSLNFHDKAFINPPSWGKIAAERMRNAGVKPEIEVFELGHIAQARSWIEEGRIESPPFFQLCLGVRWGIPASMENLHFMLAKLPLGARWSVLAVGRNQWAMLQEGILLGGHIRVGFEDSLYLRKGVKARSNAELVSRAVGLAQEHGRLPATPDEAREILYLR